mmetsp:Transcript_28191/g.81664  ORF Transcript_28191/g.81664 Transcript_28191/m.81664 type:complete len:221 (-) Transcript_28191:3827-4489(-)
MDQAQLSRRVLAEHLVQHLAETAGAHLNAPLRDRVLDRGGEDVRGLDDLLAGRRARRLRRLLHDAKVDAAAQVACESPDAEGEPQRQGRGGHQHHPRRVDFARVVRQRRQVAVLAHEPVAAGVLLGEVVRREDGHMARREGRRDQQVALAAGGIHDGHARGLEQVHEGLAFPDEHARGQGVLRRLRPRRLREGEDDEQGLRGPVSRVVVELPVGKLLHGA